MSEKIVRENAFEQKKKKPGLNLTLGLALIGLPTTGPWSERFTGYFSYKKRVNVADSIGIPVLTSCLCSLQ